eukprot:NODE_6039_length_1711_cov_2.071970.p1 GENE.NODE_6039_length_1711_cov_2.071970~~NODE_6039_length_1711_cov_2.071970.p1  ORF type:complete len:351 (-),score=86.27 NODE_6039_length_1711_cov_2.071970:208-1260(-)
MGVGGARALAGLLMESETLEVLNVEGCRIPAAGIEALKSSGTRSRSLKKLTVGNVPLLIGGARTGITDASVREITEAVAARPTTLASSNFGDAYGGAVDYPNKPELFAGIEVIITMFAAGKHVTQAFADGHARRLFQNIESKGLTEVRHLAAAAWTSQEELDGPKKYKFYGMIQEVLRRDEAGTLMSAVARYCRTMNKLLVTRGPAPMSTIPNVTERGAWFPQRELKWFAAGRTYRCPMYLPTSRHIHVAKRFLAMASPAPDPNERFVPVLMHFHFDVAEGCSQVNLLRALSDYPEEEEWLFQAYSSFRVRTPAALTGAPFTLANPAEIHIDVLPDNRDVPLDAPLANWH